MENEKTKFVLTHEYADYEGKHFDIWKVYNTLENAKIDLKDAYNTYTTCEDYFDKDEVDFNESYIRDDGCFAYIVSKDDEDKYDKFEIQEIESE